MQNSTRTSVPLSPQTSPVPTRATEICLVNLPPNGNEKLPLLVILMNNLIHHTVSLNAFRNRDMLAHLHQVFSYFAELGETARLFLLKNQTVGRMLDFFYSEKSKFNAKFRDESLARIPYFQC